MQPASPQLGIRLNLQNPLDLQLRTTEFLGNARRPLISTFRSPRPAIHSLMAGGSSGRVPTGFAAETYISEHTFREGHRAVEGGSNSKKRKREAKGNSGIVSGAGAYKGPWAKYEEERPDAASDDEFGSDEEVEIIYEEDEIEENPEAAPEKLAGTDYHDTEAAGETSAFVGSQQYDYQGRTYMHVPTGRLSVSD